MDTLVFLLIRKVNATELLWGYIRKWVGLDQLNA